MDAAVEAAGVRTWSTEEMAQQLLTLSSAEVRAQPPPPSVDADPTGGLTLHHLRALRAQVEVAALKTEATEPVATVSALLPPSCRCPHVDPSQWGHPRRWPTRSSSSVTVRSARGAALVPCRPSSASTPTVLSSLTLAGVPELVDDRTVDLVGHSRWGGWYDKRRPAGPRVGSSIATTTRSGTLRVRFLPRRRPARRLHARVGWSSDRDHVHGRDDDSLLRRSRPSSPWSNRPRSVSGRPASPAPRCVCLVVRPLTAASVACS